MIKVRFCLFFILLLTIFNISGQTNYINYKPFRANLKWGIKDTLGNITLTPIYDNICNSNQTNFFIAVTAKETKKELISDSLTTFLHNNLNYYGYNLKNASNDEYNDSIIILYKPEFSLIDKTGKKIISENYDDIIDMNSCYQCKKSNKYYFIASDGKVKGPWDYYYSLYSMLKSKQEYPDYFLVNQQGENKIFYKQDSTIVYDVLTESEIYLIINDSIKYRKGGRFSILNNLGDKVLSSDFEEIKIFYRLITDMNSGEEDSSAYLCFSDSSSWKYINRNIYINAPIFGKINGKWGTFSLDGKISCPYEFDKIELYIDYLNFVYIGYKNTKKHLIKPENGYSPAFDNFLELQKLDSTFNIQTAYYIIQNGGSIKDIVAKRDTIPYENWETGGMDLKVNEVLTPCFSGGKFKILNENLQQITNEEYDSLKFFVNDYTFSEVETIKLRDFSDSTSNISSINIVPETPILTCKNGLWGAIKPSGELLFSNKFNSVKMEYFNGKRVIETGCDGLTGVLSLDGKVLIEPDYNSFIPLFSDVSEDNWASSLAFFYKNGKMGVINMSGKEIIPAIYDSISTNNENYFVNKGGIRKHCFIENEFNGYDPYEGMDVMRHNVYKNVFMINGKWGTIDTLGKPIIETKYDQLTIPFVTSNSYGEITNNTGELYLFTIGGKNTLAEVKENDTLIDLNSYLEYSENFSNVVNKTKCNPEYLFKGAKYGLVDKTGKVIISNCDTIAFVNWGITDLSGEYFELIYITIKDNDYKIFDNSGKEIHPVENISISIHSLSPYFDYGKSLYGLKDRIGRIIVYPIYNIISDFKDEFALVRKKNKYGFINKKGVVVIPIEYDSAELFYSGKAKVKNGGKYFYIDKAGHVVK